MFRLKIARMNTRPWQSDARWFDPNRNSSDEDYEEDFVYDEEEDEDYDNENDYTNRNGTNVNGSMIPSAKQSFDGVSDDYVDERLDERKPLPLNEDEYDATVTDEPPRNETVKRWVNTHTQTQTHASGGNHCSTRRH